mmetsp:Transcript_22949/g.27156  ORF Transcript_22949/g.27156 Transcript_22949/m.27156 type:complete len:548 (-) Transcript_22949:82-1725(-)
MARHPPTDATIRNKLSSSLLPAARKLIPSARSKILTAAAFCTLSHHPSVVRHLSYSLSSPAKLRLHLNGVNGLETTRARYSSPHVETHIPFIYQSTAAISSSSRLHASIGGTPDSSSITNDTKGNDGSLPLDYPRLDSLKPALSAIRKACRITSYLQPITVASKISGATKKDSSPVTIGDFSAQALVLNLLERNFEEDILIAEESSADIEEKKEGGDDDNDVGGPSSSLADDIMGVLETCGFTSYISNVEELKRSIDLGQTYLWNGDLIPGLEEGSDRRWCLDPIDGTRGFLRGKREGGQYCVALTLIEDGVPVMGILGCPNLPTSPNEKNYKWSEDETEGTNQDTRGCIFVASKGGGTYQLPLNAPSPSTATTIQVTNEKEDQSMDEDASTEGAIRIHTTSDKDNIIPVNQARFCMGVETYGDPKGECRTIAKKIHGALDPSVDGGGILYSRRMDSQVKYGVLARGEAEIFVRLPKKSYVEWIWDHAAGRIVIEEAGGIQTDIEGERINYGLGAKMDSNVDGILASSGGAFHDKLLGAYREMVKER